jgi:hypothetical protein
MVHITRTPSGHTSGRTPRNAQGKFDRVSRHQRATQRRCTAQQHHREYLLQPRTQARRRVGAGPGLAIWLCPPGTAWRPRSRTLARLHQAAEPDRVNASLGHEPWCSASCGPGTPGLRRLGHTSAALPPGAFELSSRNPLTLRFPRSVSYTVSSQRPADAEDHSGGKLACTPIEGKSQGQRSLRRCSERSFRQEAVVPTATAAFHCEAIAAGMLLQQR